MEYSLEKGLFLTGVGEVKDKKIALPIAVNWNITGSCTNNCFYCYGNDIVGKRLSCLYPQIAENILSLSPKAVVLTGGEPLIESNFFGVANVLRGKTNLILDTNGILLDGEKIAFLKEGNFHVRISLDSDNPIINEKNRPSRVKDSTQKIKGNILALKNAGVPFTVQTTVTDFNIGGLASLGRYLSGEGVKNWRIAAVIPSGSAFKEKLINIFSALKKEFPHMSLRLSNCENEESAGIILFDPDGNCIIRGTANNDKNSIFPFGCGGLKKKILSLLDYGAHIARYSLTVNE